MTTQAKSKPAARKPRAAAAAKKTPKSFLQMIQEAIKSGDEKKGVSRAAIKSFITAKYHVDFKDRAKVNRLSRTLKKAITDQTIRNGRCKSHLPWQLSIQAAI